MPIVKIPQRRFDERMTILRNHLSEKEIAHFIVFNPTHIYYLTGFVHIPTERPFAMIVQESDVSFFVPELERQHVEEEVVGLAKIGTYFDYPDATHPMKHFATFLKKDLGIKDRLGAEAPGSSGRWGYEGPKLEEVLGFPVQIFSQLLTDMRIIKDVDELSCIRESAMWANLAHQLLQEKTAVGLNEVEVSTAASLEASLAMGKALGIAYRPFAISGLPVHAGYRGQIGTYSAIPHAMTRFTIFQKGDTLVTGATANVAGYYAELERTMFLGEPTAKQRKYFDIMMEAQDAAFEAFAPGAPCSKVDQASRAVFKKHGVMNLVQHHTGHAIGLEGHEKPFLDHGMDVIMKPGMVFTVEPGIYDQTIGGFRHSDTIFITEDGKETVTYYPRDIDYLTIDLES
ncbi:MAG: M24 family metallopeptidase [Candidatus Thorarchaeota archaeon]